MNNFFAILTPKEMSKIDKKRSLSELRDMANAPDRTCHACEQEKVWKYAGVGLCFSCTTGESDASDDYELRAEGTD